MTDEDRAGRGMRIRTPVSVAIFLPTYINPTSNPTLNGPRSSRRGMRFATTGKALPGSMVFMIT